MPWLGGAIVLGALVKFWYVVVPVLAIVVLSVVTIRVRDKRRAKLAARAAGSAMFAEAMQREMRIQEFPEPLMRAPLPYWAPQAQPQPQFPYDPRVPQPQAPQRPAWMGQQPSAYAPRPTFTPRPNAYGVGTHRPR